jgi:type IV pilus assembly protein PilB
MSPARRKRNSGDDLVKQEIITREELEEARKREQATGVPWHRYLLQMGTITFGAVEDALRFEFHSKSDLAESESLGRTLVELGEITEIQLQDALTEQKRNGRLLGKILERSGLVTHDSITKALAKQHGMEYASLSATRSQQAALGAVHENLARKNRMIPIRLDGDRLSVLVEDPQAREKLQDVGVMIGKRIHCILTASDDIRKEVTARYRGSSTTAVEEPEPVKPPKAAAAPKKNAKPKPEEIAVETNVESSVQSEEGISFKEIAKQASGLPVINLVQTMIEGAANSGATDIHLDPQEPEMRVRYRIDGVLHDVMSLRPDIEPAVVSRIKIMADLDITETRHPQDGHISLELADAEYDIRVATLPTFLGERVVLRLLDQATVLSGIKDLGLEKEDETKLIRLTQQPYGMILVTGPTGSGKTTTLYSLLNQKNVMTDSIVTLEDPVEYQMSGINQVQIDTDIGVTFANTLRASMRQDIDVLLVGEIRDPETARIAIRAAMTGHLVFSTLHTNDAPEAISTLRNMKVPAYLISSALTAVVAQRLVRKICPECKASFVPNKTLLKSVGLPESTKRLYRGKGCTNCYNTGTRGRTGIFEVIEMTPDIRKLIGEEATVEKIMKAAKLKTMADRCRAKLKDGLVPPEEFLRVIRT